MENNETRYQRQKKLEASKDRHAQIVERLALPTVQQWELAMEEFRPQCAVEGIPSRWVDWSSDPELREPEESDRLPTADEAKALCEGCPITGPEGLCRRYAKATGQAHGIWGGGRIEKGKWLKDDE